MKVCEVCGALQSAGDTDKRLTMHLEGKLHAGYLKIRKKHQDLKNKRTHDRKSGGSRYRSRSRSRSPKSGRRDGRRGEEDLGDFEELEKKVIFSSKRHGSGRNVPSLELCSHKFATDVMGQNSGYSGASVAMDNMSLGKEWRYYKRELDSIRRKAKKDAERAAGSGGPPTGGFNAPRRDFSRGGGNDFNRGGNDRGFRSHHRDGGYGGGRR